MSGCIGGCHGENHAESRIVGSGQIVTGQTPGHIVFCKEPQTKGTRDVGEEEDKDEVAAGLTAVSSHVVV